MSHETYVGKLYLFTLSNLNPSEISNKKFFTTAESSLCFIT